MGLDCSHDVWHGPYGAFTRWRNAIAEMAGYCVWDVKLPDGIIFPTIILHWGSITDENLNGEWQKTPDDPLIVLFAHSDCEGIIKPEQGKPLADALEKLLSHPDMKNNQNVENVTKIFVKGLRSAYKNKEDVEFY